MPSLTSFPFLYGAQYYRAPTPGPECWETDLRRLRMLGANAVKFFVQWRWSHRSPERFVFGDLDRLMDLAAAHGLSVTLNVIFDVSPLWLFDVHPDARQITNDGRTVQPQTAGHRQIGGLPGPCYNHPGAQVERRRFLTAVVEHFRAHPAMGMWDVWNEPEQCFFSRTPDVATLVCYCQRCREGFVGWLREKYGTLEALNTVWGRPYEEWAQVELPRNPHTVTDFIDWREFQLDSMTAEARWRLRLTRTLDAAHPVYLHVVPNTMRPFNAVTCVDDFALAPECDVFAATMNGGPVFAGQVVSAARGKICYNVESHVNGGCLNLEQCIVGLPELLRDFLPQIGLGVRGFLFWQYRAETLGFEAPAWGLVRPDGGDRPVTAAARRFWEVVSPYADALMRTGPAPAAVGILRSRRNEIFHFCMQGNLDGLARGVEAYIDAFYRGSYPHRIVSGEMLARGELAGFRLLVLPSAYYLTREETDALDAWVRAGGVAFCESPLAGYEASRGRLAPQAPGSGLAERWGLREQEVVSSYHLDLADGTGGRFTGEMTPDVKKALADFGMRGGAHFPLPLADGRNVAWGAHRCALIGGEEAVLAVAPGLGSCVVSKTVGKGTVFYAGTLLGLGAADRGGDGLRSILSRALAAAGVEASAGVETVKGGLVHLDQLCDAEGEARFLVWLNDGDQEAITRWSNSYAWEGLFSGQKLVPGEQTVTLPAKFVDLFVRSDEMTCSTPPR